MKIMSVFEGIAYTLPATRSMAKIDDFRAVGALRERHTQGLSMPSDISVIGCDNIGLPDVVCPSLTTLNISRDKIGHLVFEAFVPQTDHTWIQVLELQIDPELTIANPPGPPRKVEGKPNTHGPLMRKTII